MINVYQQRDVAIHIAKDILHILCGDGNKSAMKTAFQGGTIYDYE